MKSQFSILASIMFLTVSLWACADGIPGIGDLKGTDANGNKKPVTVDGDALDGDAESPTDLNTEAEGDTDLPVVEGPETSASYSPSPRPSFSSTPTP